MAKEERYQGISYPEDRGKTNKKKHPKVPFQKSLLSKSTASIDAHVTQSKPDTSTVLSPRQKQLLKMKGSGLTPTEIAEQLGITRGTVNDSIRKVRQKAGIPTEATLVF